MTGRSRSRLEDLHPQLTRRGDQAGIEHREAELCCAAAASRTRTDPVSSAKSLTHTDVSR
jgi:hypothetical protein